MTLFARWNESATGSERNRQRKTRARCVKLFQKFDFVAVGLQHAIPRALNVPSRALEALLADLSAPDSVVNLETSVRAMLSQDQYIGDIYKTCTIYKADDVDDIKALTSSDCTCVFCECHECLKDSALPTTARYICILWAGLSQSTYVLIWIMR